MNRLQKTHDQIYFTLEQAQALLPKIKRLAKRLMKIKKSIEIYDLIDVEFDDDNYTEHIRNLRINKQFHKLHYEFFTLLEAIEGTGAIVKDLDLGLIDFFSFHGTKEILLCWKIGEPKLSHWHEVHEGYEQRRPIFFLEDELKEE
ncbi:DUF2203 domain-containing protein [Candidatus Woesearchaeota archaeon]|nr:DUF2203 domain-containing protein [Candidatus Woesearchaeota archaeon]